MKLTGEEAIELLDNMTASTRQWCRNKGRGETKKGAGVYSIPLQDHVSAQLAALTNVIEKLALSHSQLQQQTTKAASTSPYLTPSCNQCGSTHETSHCEGREDVNFIHNRIGNSYSNSFNQGGWKNNQQP